MESKELIADFREQLDDVEAKGLDQVKLFALRNYLEILEKDAEASQDSRNREHAGMLAEFSAKTEISIEMLKSVLEAGKSALQTLLIINGGAAVALLSVVSNLAGKDGASDLAKCLALPLLQFGVGVLAGAIAFAMRYLSQACYAEVDNEKDKSYIFGNIFKGGAIISAFCGYVLFGVAVYNAYFAVINFNF